MLVPVFAFAQTASVTAPLNPVPIYDSGSLTANNTFNAALLPIQATNTASCNAPLKTFESTDQTAQLGLSFSAVIGGGGAYADALQAEIDAYGLYITCEQGVLASLNALTAPNSYTSSIKQQNITQVNASIQTYKTKKAAAQAKYNTASQDVWKALLITILLNTTKSVADQLVNKLVNNYKISNIMAYTNSLATLAYDNQFIRQNFPDAQSQMVARTILSNPAAASQLQPGIVMAANNALGYDPTTVSLSDPNFYSKMAATGYTQSNPYYLQTMAVASVDQAHASALASAQMQISQGNGYKAPVNCAGSLAQQKAIDTQNAALSAQIDNRQALLNNLTNAQAANLQVNPNDIKKAQADLTAAQNAWNNYPDSLPSSSPAIVMCEAVSSPAVLVNQGIDSMFNALGANVSQYNNSNLPGFLSSISSIATKIGSSLVLGASPASHPQ